MHSFVLNLVSSTQSSPSSLSFHFTRKNVFPLTSLWSITLSTDSVFSLLVTFSALDLSCFCNNLIFWRGKEPSILLPSLSSSTKLPERVTLSTVYGPWYLDSSLFSNPSLIKATLSPATRRSWVILSRAFCFSFCFSCTSLMAAMVSGCTTSTNFRSSEERFTSKASSSLWWSYSNTLTCRPNIR